MNGRPLMSRRVFESGLLASALTAAAPISSRADPPGHIRVSVRDSLDKLVLPAAATDEAAPQIALHAARNDTATFQVVIQADEKPAADVRIAPKSPATGAGALAVELFLVHYVAVVTPSDAYGSQGLWPDALVPLREPVQIESRAPTVVWVRITIPADAKPGLYEASLAIECEGANPRSVSWTLVVHDVVLPAAPTLPFMVGIDWDSVTRVDGAAAGGAAALEADACLYFAALRAAGATPLNPFYSTPRLEDGDQEFEEAVDRRLREALGEGLEGPAPVPFSLRAPIDAGLQPPFSEPWRVLAIAYLRRVAKCYERMGVIDRAFIYLAEADEPTRSAQIRLIGELHRLVQEADPRLRVAQTIHARCFDCDFDALAALESQVTLWVPNIAFYDGRAVGLQRSLTGGHRVREFPSGWPGDFDRRVRQSGRSVWWYLDAATAALPKEQQPRYPSLHIDDSGMSHRMVAWAAWDQRINAVGYWMATCWRGSSNPWRGSPRGENGQGANGDGVLLYPRAGAAIATGQPTPDAPCPSIRLETIREAGADHKLLSLAELKLGRDAVRRIIAPLSLTLDSSSPQFSELRLARLHLLKELSK